MTTSTVEQATHRVPAVRRVTSTRQARDLAHHLAEPDRAAPVLVITEPATGQDPYFDVDTLAGHVEGAAQLVVVAAGATFTLTTVLGRYQSVYGGAARLYPADPTWLNNPARLAPLFHAHTPAQAHSQHDQIVEATLDAAFRAGWLPDTYTSDDPTAPSPAELARDNQHLTEQLQRAHRRIHTLEARITTLTSTPTSTPTPRHRPTVFDDPGEQFAHDVHLAWLERIPPTDRARWTLPQDYQLGPDFLPSLTALTDPLRDKAINVTVEILTGLARTQPGRQLHPWRTGRTGPQQTRPDGATAWRASLQANTPADRRIKYWHHPDGHIELDTIATHDHGI